MDLRELLVKHRQGFKNKVVEKFAEKYSISFEEAMEKYQEIIEEFVKSRYERIDRVLDRIYEIDMPVVLNIRRDRQREDVCRICEENEPNIVALDKKYGERIVIFEISEDKPEGGLYDIIFQEEGLEEKKLPLTAVIFRGEVKKYWAGKAVDLEVYELYLKGLA